MKSFILCACFLIALPLFAGKRIVQEGTNLTNNTTTQQELLFDGSRFRANYATSSVIFLTDGGLNRMITLDKGRNEYMEIDQATMDQMGQAMAGVNAQMEAALKDMPPEQRAQMQQMMAQMMKGKMPAAAPTVTTSYTAKGKSTVNGFACTNYDGVRAGEKVAELCAAQPADLKLGASDFQVFRKMQEFTKSMMQAMQNSPIASAINVNVGDAAVDGYPVQQITFRNGQAADRVVVKSVTDATLTDADFSVGNAKKMEMPNMSGITGQGKAKGKGK